MSEQTQSTAQDAPRPAESYCPGCLRAARRYLGMEVEEPELPAEPCDLHRHDYIEYINGQECQLAEAEQYVATHRPACWN